MLRKTVFGKLFLATIAINILTIVCIFLLNKYLPPVVPLLYGKPLGAEQLLPKTWLILAPLISILITGINLFLNNITEDVFIKKVLAISAFLISTMTTITVVKIITLVGFY